MDFSDPLLPAKPDASIVSHSEVESYGRCRRAHFYAFGMRLQKKGLSPALNRGTLGHAVMESFFRARQEGKDWDESKAVAMQRLLEGAVNEEADFDSINTLNHVIPLFFVNFRERVEKWEVVYIEEEFRLKIGGTVEYPFKPDLIVREHGILTIIDYKFVADYYSADLMALQPQLPKYMGALRAVGIDVHKAAYIFFRTRKMKWDGKPFTELCNIVAVSINNDRLRNTWREQITATLEIAEYKQMPREEWDNRALRSVSKDCSWCNFKDLCTAQLQGSDGATLIRTEYETNTYGYDKKELES